MSTRPASEGTSESALSPAQHMVNILYDTSKSAEQQEHELRTLLQNDEYKAAINDGAKFFIHQNTNPLQTALNHSNKNICKLLLDHGADPKLSSLDSIAYAIQRHGDSEILNYMESKGLDINRVDQTGNNLFNYSLRYRSDYGPRYLHSRGVGFVENRNKQTILHFANDANIDFIYEIAPDADRFINTPSNDGSTPILHATSSLKLLDRFLEKGAEFHPKILSIAESDPEILTKIFVARQVDPEIITSYIKENSRSITLEMLEISLQELNKQGRNPDIICQEVVLASTNKYTELKGEDILDMSIRNGWNQTVDTIWRNKPAMVYNRIPSNEHTIAEGTAGFNKLHLAVKYNNRDALTRLLSYANPSLISEKTISGETPLEFYCSQKLKSGNPVDAKDMSIFKAFASLGANCDAAMPLLNEDQKRSLNISIIEARASVNLYQVESAAREGKYDLAQIKLDNTEYSNQASFNTKLRYERLIMDALLPNMVDDHTKVKNGFIKKMFAKGVPIHPERLGSDEVAPDYFGEAMKTRNYEIALYIAEQDPHPKGIGKGAEPRQDGDYLIQAIKDGQIDLVRQLIAKGSSIDKESHVENDNGKRISARQYVRDERTTCDPKIRDELRSMFAEISPPVHSRKVGDIFSRLMGRRANHENHSSRGR